MYKPDRRYRCSAKHAWLTTWSLVPSVHPRISSMIDLEIKCLHNTCKSFETFHCSLWARMLTKRLLQVSILLACYGHGPWSVHGQHHISLVPGELIPYGQSCSKEAHCCMCWNNKEQLKCMMTQHMCESVFSLSSSKQKTRYQGEYMHLCFG